MYAKSSLSLWLWHFLGRAKGGRTNKNRNSSGSAAASPTILLQTHLLSGFIVCSATCLKPHLEFCSKIHLHWPCSLLKLEYKLNHLCGEDKFHSTLVKAPTWQRAWYPALQESGCSSNWIFLMAQAKTHSQKSLPISEKRDKHDKLLGRRARHLPDRDSS